MRGGGPAGPSPLFIVRSPGRSGVVEEGVFIVPTLSLALIGAPPVQNPPPPDDARVEAAWRSLEPVSRAEVIERFRQEVAWLFARRAPDFSPGGRLAFSPWT